METQASREAHGVETHWQGFQRGMVVHWQGDDVVCEDGVAW
jgi:hypothetical protein